MRAHTLGGKSQAQEGFCLRRAYTGSHASYITSVPAPLQRAVGHCHPPNTRFAWSIEHTEFV